MKKIYLHEGQQRYIDCSANSSINICSRRWGKSYIVAYRIWQNVLEMPGSTGVFLASSFRQAHSRTLPSALQALDAFGVKRDIHYVIGKKPPKSLGFKSPFFEPSDLKDVIWFANGTIMVIVSQEVVLSANSMTIHWLVGDEAKGLDYDKLSNEIFPALGGAAVHFNDPKRFPHLWGFHFFTDMPCTKEGLWLVNRYENKYDKELCDHIIRLQQVKTKLMMLPSLTDHQRCELSEINASLNIARSHALDYQERSIYDNIKLVGHEYIKRCERDLTPMVFRASILCKRITEVEGRFYQNFDSATHTYLANDNSKLDNYKNRRYDCLIDTDVQRDKPIAISFDYNAQITWLCCGQVQGSKFLTLKSFYTKYNQRLRECIQLFCEYYQPHVNKTVIYYYDSTAIATNYTEVGHSADFVVCDEFARHGWHVIKKYMSTPMEHSRKHLIINNALAGTEKLFPMWNKDNNVELLQAIPLTGIRIGEKGFRKDKSGEKALESENTLPYELRTDATDAWDNVFLGCLMQPYDDRSFIYV